MAQKEQDERKRDHIRKLEEKRMHSDLAREKKRNVEVRDIVIDLKNQYKEDAIELAEAKKRLIQLSNVQLALAARKRAMEKKKWVGDFLDKLV